MDWLVPTISHRMGKKHYFQKKINLKIYWILKKNIIFNLLSLLLINIFMLILLIKFYVIKLFF